MKAYIADNLDGRISGMVTAKNLKHAAELLGTSLYALRQYGWELAEGEDLALAAAAPGTIFVRRTGSSEPWRPQADAESYRRSSR